MITGTYNTPYTIMNDIAGHEINRLLLVKFAFPVYAFIKKDDILTSC